MKTLYNDLISLVRHRGNRSKGHVDRSGFFKVDSEGSNETNGGSNGIHELANSPRKLLGLDEEGFLGAGRTGRSTWAREMNDKFSTCTGNREPEWYDAAEKELERLEQMRV